MIVDSPLKKHYTLGGRAYPVRHYPIAIRLRDRKGRAILCIALTPQNGDSSGAILEVPFKALLHGRLSVIGRWNRGRYKRSKRDGNLNKQHFLVVGSSLVVPWFFFGSSLVTNMGATGKQRER